MENNELKNNTLEQTNTVEESAVVPPRRHRNAEKERGANFMLRQVLNILFMLIAVVGCVVYIKVNDKMGAILIVIAMAFKMAECVLRYKK